VYYKTIPLFGLFFALLPGVNGQTLYIQNGKKRIKILRLSTIEIKTWNDSLLQADDSKSIPFTVNSIAGDSIYVVRTTEWKDTFRYKFNFLTGKDIKEKKKYQKIPSKYEYRQFSLKDISQITYTYQRDQSGEGCLGCMLIPGLNLYYLWSKARRTRVFDMSKWVFVWK
jgi:hypothetical protein